MLTKRSFVNMSRDFGYYWLRLVIYLVVTFCIGTIYLNVGTAYNSILVNISDSLTAFNMPSISFLKFPSYLSSVVTLAHRQGARAHHLCLVL